MKNIFITGTDTNSNEAFIAAGLAATMQSLGYSTGVYKPVEFGLINKKGRSAQSNNLLFVKQMDSYIKTCSSYLLKTPTIPSIAAEIEHVLIDKNIIKKDYESFAQDNNCTIVEGIGGFLTPLAPNFLVKDMVKMLNLPIVIVISPNSDTINNTLLTINNATANGINVRGVIINNFPDNTSDISIKSIPRLIEEYSDVKVLGIMKQFDDVCNINPSDLITNTLNGIDIESVFDVAISRLSVE